MRQIDLIFDELLNNVISYAFLDQEEHAIELRVGLSGERLVVTIEDEGVPFNPFDMKKPDTSLPLEKRSIGGLGIHLVRNMMDEVSYSRRTDKNVVILVKHLEAGSDA